MSNTLIIVWPLAVFGFGLFMTFYIRRFWPRLNAERFSLLFLGMWVGGLLVFKWDGPLAEKLGAIVGWLMFAFYGYRRQDQNG